MKIIYFFSLFFFVFFVGVGYAEENLKLITYYPSHGGDYQEVRTTDKTLLASTNGIVDIGGVRAPGENEKVNISGKVVVTGITMADHGLQLQTVDPALNNDPENDGRIWLDPAP